MIFDLEQIIAKGENERVEFKRSLAEEREIIETIGAFLNHQGGLIIVGYDEKKKRVIEPDIGEETIQKLINKVKSVTVPQVIIDAYESEYQGKKLLIISVIDYPIKPVAVQGRYFRRRMNSNHVMTPTEITNLHLFTLNSSWDYQIAQEYTLKDIDMDTVEWFIERLSEQKGKKIKDKPLQVLEKYEVIREDRPTFAAMLLFPRNPSFILDVQIGLFEDEITIKKDKNIKKSVLLEVDEIMDFITAYITKEFIITGRPQREERWQYPLEAIRELAVNAVIHRDYQEGTHTQIKVFRDKISLWNSGKLPPDLTIADIKKGIVKSRPRNRLLAQVFKDLGIIEKYGAGVRRVIEDFKAYSLQPPLFEEISGGFLVTASNSKESNDFIAETSRETSRETSQETSQEIKPPPDKQPIHSIGNEIILILQDDPYVTRKKLAHEVGIPESTVRYHLDLLKKNGLITRVGATKKGYWKIL